MICFSNAKINLGLNVLDRREDGFHNIESVFYPIPFSDLLEIKLNKEFVFTTTGIQVPLKNNLCEQAFRLLQDKFNIENVKIHLHKNIPVGAGLGGGSSNAAYTLIMLNDIFKLNLTHKELQFLGLKIGSDCAFFIENKPVFIEGRGEKMNKIDLDLKGKYLTILNPNIHISTKWAYQNLVIGKKKSNLKLMTNNVNLWKSFVYNDFENLVFSEYSEVSKLKHDLIKLGAEFALMTGSGSSVYAFFDKQIKLNSPVSSFVCWSGFV